MSAFLLVAFATVTVTVTVYVTFVDVVTMDLEAGTYTTSTPLCSEGEHGMVCQ